MASTIAERNCSHHWVIDTPNGTFSHGRCKRCGSTREFRNSSEDQQWSKDSFTLRGPRTTRKKAS